MKKFATLTIALALLASTSNSALAVYQTSWSLVNKNSADRDSDGISDWKETNLYRTNPNNWDTDGDGASDGQELMAATDPNSTNKASLPKHIYVSIKYQELRYYTGPYLIDDFLISSGIPGKDTPPGEYSVLQKFPSVLFQGVDYYYPNTKWNLNFLPGYYIHGAYWHNNFGNKMSHGCVNVSYLDMEGLYNWAQIGTPVSIVANDFPVNLAMNLPSGTLVNDLGTIYLVSNGKKYGFTSMYAFSGLGYTLADVKKRSSQGIAAGNVLNDPNMRHVAGSWVISGQTVYYVSNSGLIPIPSWDIFVSNGGGKIIHANFADMTQPMAGMMTYADARVGG